MSPPPSGNGRHDSLAVGVNLLRAVASGTSAPGSDTVAVEEPLEIRLGYDDGGRRRHRTVAVTMRTPGHDPELAVGFLFTEGIVTARDQLAGVHICCRTANVVRVELAAGSTVDFARLKRHSYTTSSCGVCGKTSLEAVRVVAGDPPPADKPVVDAATIHGLPAALRVAQPVFDRTGGLHASALFDAHGHLRCVREDVGRHNALDKLIGCQFLAGLTPLCDDILLVSGRASFELVQKAAVAGIPVLAAVGAPSSLAVDLARERGLTLLGFVRESRFNIYSGPDRIRLDADAWSTADTAPRPSLSVV